MISHTECKYHPAKSNPSNFFLIKVDFSELLTLQTNASTNHDCCADHTQHPFPTRTSLLQINCKMLLWVNSLPVVDAVFSDEAVTSICKSASKCPANILKKQNWKPALVKFQLFCKEVKFSFSIPTLWEGVYTKPFCFPMFCCQFN